MHMVLSLSSHTRVNACARDYCSCPQSEFESVRGDMEREARRAAKLEGKLGLLLGGLQKRHGELAGRAGELWAQVRDAAQELVCFKVRGEEDLRAAAALGLGPGRAAWRLWGEAWAPSVPRRSSEMDCCCPAPKGVAVRAANPVAAPPRRGNAFKLVPYPCLC